MTDTNKFETAPQNQEALLDEKRARLEMAMLVSVGAQGATTPSGILGILPPDMQDDVQELVYGEVFDEDPELQAEAVADFIGRSQMLSDSLTVDEEDLVMLSPFGAHEVSNAFTRALEDEELGATVMAILANNAPPHLRRT